MLNRSSSSHALLNTGSARSMRWAAILFWDHPTSSAIRSMNEPASSDTRTLSERFWGWYSDIIMLHMTQFASLCSIFPATVHANFR